MAENYGKKWETVFREEWKQQFPNTFLFRLNDQVSGFKVTSQNPCDFIAFHSNKLFMIECKSHKGSSIDFSAIPQYERLLVYKNIENVYPGILIWFIEKDKVYWVPIKVAEQIYLSGEKSIGLRHVGKYNLIEIPAVKKRVYMDCDFSMFKDIEKLYK